MLVRFNAQMDLSWQQQTPSRSKSMAWVVTAANLVTSMQSIVSRSIDPLESGVITCGTINGGYTHNIIADKVVICGTARSFTPQVRNTIKTRMNSMCCGMEQCYGGSIGVKYSCKSCIQITISHTRIHLYVNIYSYICLILLKYMYIYICIEMTLALYYIPLLHIYHIYYYIHYYTRCRWLPCYCQ